MLDKKMAAVLEDYVDRQFINIVAPAKVEQVKEYEGPGIVLYAKEVKTNNEYYPPKNRINYFKIIIS